MVTYCGICYVFAGFAVNGDTCVSSGRTNPLEEGLKQTGLFRELIGCVRAVARYTKSPRETNWKTAVGILDYVFFVSDFGITFQRGSGLELVAYADADYASKATDRRSVSGGAVMCAGACAEGHACAGFRELKSDIPKEVGKLPALKKLDLSGNCDIGELFGAIPPEIGDLPALEELNLSDCQLQGAIPPEIGDLPALEELNLSYCGLRGAIPPEIGDLPALEELNLSYCGLRGAIPPEIGDLPALEELNLSYCGLRGDIPKEVGKLKALKKLNLSHNVGIGDIPKEVGKLKALKKLNLSSNLVIGTIPPEIGDLPALEELNLSYCGLRGDIPKEVGKLKALKKLDLSFNRGIGAIPPDIGDLPALEELNLLSCGLRGDIPKEVGKLKALKKLDFSRNRVIGYEAKYDVFRDRCGLVEVKIPQEHAWKMSSVTLDSKGYTAEVAVRGELVAVFIDPVVKGSHEMKFSDTSIRYFVGRYYNRLAKFDSDEEGTLGKENEKGRIRSLVIRENFSMHHPHSAEGEGKLPWEKDGEFTAVWEGCELWLEAPLTDFCSRGRGSTLRKIGHKMFRGHTTPPLTPPLEEERRMEAGEIVAAEDVRSLRMIQLFNNTNQTVYTCTIPDASPAEEVHRARAVEGGASFAGQGVNASMSSSSSAQHGAMGGAGIALLGAQHICLGAGQSSRDPLGGKGDGAILWYTVDEFRPSTLESGVFDMLRLPAGQTSATQGQTQQQHSLVRGFTLDRLEVEHGYVVDGASGHFVKKQKSLWQSLGLVRRATYPYLQIVRIRHHSRISPGLYNKMNQEKLTEGGLQDTVLLPGESPSKSVNQYLMENMVM
eukprot:jgi/Undpi1/12981/HiC_scaffold_7.g02646.m1